MGYVLMSQWVGRRNMYTNCLIQIGVLGCPNVDVLKLSAEKVTLRSSTCWIDINFDKFNTKLNAC